MLAGDHANSCVTQAARIGKMFLLFSFFFIKCIFVYGINMSKDKKFTVTCYKYIYSHYMPTAQTSWKGRDLSC